MPEARTIKSRIRIPMLRRDSKQEPDKKRRYITPTTERLRNSTDIPIKPTNQELTAREWKIKEPSPMRYFCQPQDEESIPEDPTFETAFELWSQLDQVYQTKSANDRADALKALITCRSSHFRTLEAYCAAFMDAVEALRDANGERTELNIHEENLVLMLINGLQGVPEYWNIADAAYERAEGLDLRAICSFLCMCRPAMRS